MAPLPPPDKRCSCGESHNPVPASQSSTGQRAPRHSSYHHRRKKLRNLARLRGAFLGRWWAQTTRPEWLKVCKNGERVCVLWFPVWDSLSLSSLCHSLSLTHTHTHARTHTHALVSLATRPRRLLPPTPSRLRGRQGRPTAALSSGGASRGDQREGSA